MARNNGYEIFQTMRSQVYRNGIALGSPLNNNLTAQFAWNSVNYPALTVAEFQILPESTRAARETAYKAYSENYLRTYYGNRYPGVELTFRYMNVSRQLNTSVCPIGAGGPTWSTLTQVLSENRVNACGAVMNGSAYIIGGRRAAPTGGYQLNTIEKFNFTTGAVTTGQPFNLSRSEATAVVVDSAIYHIGGMQETNATSNLVEKWSDPGFWTTGVNLSVARYGLKATAVTNGSDKGFIVTGGFLANGSTVNTCEYFSTVSNTWTTKTNMLYTTGFHTCATDSTGQVVVNPGYNGLNLIGLTMNGNLWKNIATYSNTGYAQAGCMSESGDRLYIIGGTNSQGTVFNTVKSWGTGGGEWVTEDNFPGTVWGGVALANGNDIYHFGGILNGSPTNKIFKLSQ